MKSYPLILTAGEVRAVLNGTKTQHRVMVKPQPPAGYERARVCGPWGEWENDAPPLGKFSTRCQFGTPGDRLWVRETFGFNHYDDGNTRAWKRTLYRADGLEEPSDNGSPAPWRSPLAMPRRLSRLTLEVESVRVQRVQDISKEDAKAEGATAFPRDPDGDCWTDGTHRTAFNYAWNEKHGWWPTAWDRNDWVFALTFKRVEGTR